MHINKFKKGKVKSEMHNYINNSESSLEETAAREGTAAKPGCKKPAWLIVTLAAVCLAIIICLLIPLNKSIAQNDLSIESHNWEFVLVQDNTGDIIICSSENAQLYENARVDQLLLKAEDGRIVLTSSESGNAWELSCKINSQSPEGFIYEIAYGDLTGYAGTGITRYHDGSSEYTLHLSIGGCSVKFIDKLAQ